MRKNRFLSFVVFSTLTMIISCHGRAFSQTTNDQQTVEQTSPPPAITPEDLRKAVRGAVSETQRRAEQRAAEERARAEKAEKKRIEPLQNSVESLRNQLEASTKSAEAQKVADAVEDRKNKNAMWSVFGILVITVPLAFYFWLFRPLAKKTPTVIVVPSHVKNHEGILVAPKIEELVEYSKKNGNINPVPFFADLKQDGLMPLCKVQLTADFDPLIVEADGKTCKIGWKNYPKKLASFLKGDLKLVAS